MEKHSCKFCFRRFPNGRALGGHMRSHIVHAASARPPLLPQPPQHSSSSSFGPDEDDHVGVEEEGEGGPKSYGLRENPKKSFRVVDPEFAAADYSSSFLLAAAGNGVHGGSSSNHNNAASSAVVQDRESETESSKAPSPSASVRRRSKRRRRHSSPMPPPPPAEPSEPEPVSSVSDTTPDEDVAFCLVMLSRDIWNKTKTEDHAKDAAAAADDDEEEGEEEQVEVAAVRPRKTGKSRYQCGTCRKVFKSYQALGGHRASHKKIRSCAGGGVAVATAAVGFRDEQDRGRIRDVELELNGGDQKIHECPFCFRVFSSGQALGGHKRSHLTASASAAPATAAATTSTAVVSNRAIHSSLHPPPPRPPPAATATATATATNGGGWSKFVDGFIDLNLPAPSEEDEDANDEGSFVELSAVSDA